MKIKFCPNCYKEPPLLTKKEWMISHLEMAFESQDAANYCIDRKDSMKAMRAIKGIIKKLAE